MRLRSFAFNTSALLCICGLLRESARLYVRALPRLACTRMRPPFVCLLKFAYVGLSVRVVPALRVSLCPRAHRGCADCRRLSGFLSFVSWPCRERRPGHSWETGVEWIDSASIKFRTEQKDVHQIMIKMKKKKRG